MAGRCTITVRLGRETEQRLKVLARRTKRSASLLAAEAIATYLDEGQQLRPEPSRADCERLLTLLSGSQRPEPIIRF